MGVFHYFVGFFIKKFESVSGKMFTKSGFFTILYVTKSGFYCIYIMHMMEDSHIRKSSARWHLNEETLKMRTEWGRLSFLYLPSSWQIRHEGKETERRYDAGIQRGSLASIGSWSFCRHFDTLGRIQSPSKRLFPGLVNFIPAVADHFCTTCQQHSRNLGTAF